MFFILLNAGCDYKQLYASIYFKVTSFLNIHSVLIKREEIPIYESLFALKYSESHPFQLYSWGLEFSIIFKDAGNNTYLYNELL